jgi:glycine oxidase
MTGEQDSSHIETVCYRERVSTNHLHSGKRIAIAGAGVMGLGMAYALRGEDMTLFDPAGFPAESSASFMAGGMLAPWSEIEHLPDDFMEAARRGVELWVRIIPAIKDKVEFHRNGSLIVAHPGDEYMLERLVQKIPPHAMERRENIATLEPGLSRFLTGVFIKDEAHIHPQQALAALAKIPEKRVLESVNVDTLRREYDWVIDCRGLGAEEDDKELRGVKGETVTVRNPEFSLFRPVRLMHPRYPLYIVPRPNHEFMIGATVIESSDKTVTMKSAMELLSAAYSLHPSFAESEIMAIRAGVRPAYPDNLPRITVRDRVISCNGLFRHGFLLSPVMAECVADYIAGRANPFISLFIRSDHADHDQRAVTGHRGHG